MEGWSYTSGSSPGSGVSNSVDSLFLVLSSHDIPSLFLGVLPRSLRSGTVYSSPVLDILGGFSAAETTLLLYHSIPLVYIKHGWSLLSLSM